MVGLFALCSTARAQSVAAGTGHSLFVCASGNVMTVGQNTVGQLGDGTTRQRQLPITVPSLSGVKAVAGGDETSLFLKTDGTVWGCGGNTAGQLGVGDQLNYSTLVRVGTLTDVKAIATGYRHSLFLKNDGTVWTCGSNQGGALGTGNTSAYLTTPMQINGLTGVVAIAAGYVHSLFLKSDGTVWGLGQSLDGELGGGRNEEILKSPTQIPGLSNITAIAASREYRAHSLFLQSNGTVLACGSNYYGGVGSGTPGATMRVNTPTPVAG
ncbi:RCC1 domain-containing protein [Hymenobacter cellulosilyticus]|uniref:Chromosome condensation regulator RCC1 n=1 Tax=Hymenobacter cellulosilyticus TaxID=2932248 RepID=A0A8T9Q544_9BACT|nr:hypothetical protein [Hymenobacter cellulosilyticus]UOQ71551.1 hypothetical protein MUN79_23510 [Hymenobacter cellulosilyticus]